MNIMPQAKAWAKLPRPFRPQTCLKPAKALMARFRPQPGLRFLALSGAALGRFIEDRDQLSSS